MLGSAYDIHAIGCASACHAALVMGPWTKLRRGVRLQGPSPGFGRSHERKARPQPRRAHGTNRFEKAWQRAAPRGGRLDACAPCLLSATVAQNLAANRKQRADRGVVKPAERRGATLARWPSPTHVTLCLSWFCFAALFFAFCRAPSSSFTSYWSAVSLGPSASSSSSTSSSTWP